MLIPLKKLVGRAFLVLLVALVAGCSNEAKRKRHFTRAEAYFAKGQYQRAEIEYLNVMRLGPLDPQVVARLGSLYFAQGRSAEAYPLLQKAKELRPEDLDVRFKLGSLLVAHRRHADARTEAEFILGKKKDSAEGVLLLVDSVNSMESAVAARLLLTDLIRGGADTWAVRVGLAQLAMRENRNAEAAKEIEAAARLDNRAPEVEIVRANLALANKDVASAERFFALAYSNAPARSPHKLPIVRWKVQAGDRTAAKQYLSQILQDAPDFVPALALRGQIALGEQDFREADRIADAVLAWNRQSYEIRLLKARSLVLQGQPAKALEHFEQLASIYPDSAEVKYETAVAHVQNGAVNEALKSLDEAIRLAPAYAEAVILRAEIQLRTGMAEQALAGLLPFTRQFPRVDAAREVLARAYRMRGRANEALEIYRDLAAKYTNAPQFHALAGTVLRGQRKNAEARVEYEKALIVQPLYIGAAEELLELDLVEEKLADAERRAAQQLVLHTNSPAALMLRAKAELGAGKTNAAIATLKTVIQRVPEATAPYAILASLYINTGDSLQAVTNLENVVNRDNRDASAHMQLGMLHSKLGNLSAAREAYEKVITLRPRFSGAWNNLGYLLAERMNEVELGFRAALKARELDPYDEYSADTLGWIYFRKGNLAQALPLLRESAAKLTTEQDVLYHLARAEYQAGNETEAREACQAFLKLGGDAAKRNDIEQRLAILNVFLQTPGVAVLPLEAAVKADAQDVVAGVRLGAAYEALDQPKKARDAFEQVLRVQPSAVQPHLRLAVLYSGKLDDLAKASEHAKAARKLAPNDPAVNAAAARIAALTGDFPGALTLLQEQARSSATNVSRHDLAVAYFNVGQFDHAMRMLSSGAPLAANEQQLRAMLEFAAGQGSRAAAAEAVRARLSQSANDGPALFISALLAKVENKPADAAALLEKVVDRNKFLPQARRELVLLYTQLDKLGKVLEHGPKAVQAFPTDALLARAAARAAFARGDYSSAAATLARFPDDPDAQFWLALSYDKLQRRSDATNILMRLAASSHPVASEARRILETFR